jgi:hypothetical protein
MMALKRADARERSVLILIVLPVNFLGFSSANDMTYIDLFFSPRENSGRKKAGTRNKQ